MLGSLVSGLLELVSEPFAAFAYWFLSLIDLSLDDFITYFPAAGTLYGVFQAVGTGLAVGLAGFSLLRFMAGVPTGPDSPYMTAGRTVLSVSLIHFGNYILEFVIGLFRMPYEEIIGGDYTSTFYERLRDVVSGMVDFRATLEEGSFLKACWGEISSVAALLVSLVLLVIFAVNLMEFLMEVVERYMLLCVLVFTSPLAFSTVSSGLTSSVFSSWMRMFTGQCMLVLLNGWSVQMLVSGIFASDVGILLKLLLAIGFTKIAKKLDTYMQMLGVNVGTAGGSMYGDVRSAASAVRAAGSGMHSGVKGAVLGKNGMSQVLTGARPAVNAAASTFSSVRTGADGPATAGERLGAAVREAARSVVPREYGSPVLDRSGRMTGLDDTAVRCGLSFSSRDGGMISGEPSAVSGFIGGYLSSAPAMPESVARTIANTISVNRGMHRAALNAGSVTSSRSIGGAVLRAMTGSPGKLEASLMAGGVSPAFSRGFSEAVSNHRTGKPTGPQITALRTGKGALEGTFRGVEGMESTFRISGSPTEGSLPLETPSWTSYISFGNGSAYDAVPLSTGESGDAFTGDAFQVHRDGSAGFHDVPPDAETPSMSRFIPDDLYSSLGSSGLDPSFMQDFMADMQALGKGTGARFDDVSCSDGRLQAIYYPRNPEFNPQEVTVSHESFGNSVCLRDSSNSELYFGFRELLDESGRREGRSIYGEGSGKGKQRKR